MDAMKALGIVRTSPIYADAAEPKDILDMRRMGWNVIAAQKGPDSVRNGIKFVKQFDVFVDEKSLNLLREAENYRWALDQFKNPTDEPEDKNNHLMDAIRYALTKIQKPTGMRVI